MAQAAINVFLQCLRTTIFIKVIMVLEAHLQQAVLLKKVVDAMKDLCKDEL